MLYFCYLCRNTVDYNDAINHVTWWPWARASRSPSRRRLLLIPSGDQHFLVVANFILFCHKDIFTVWSS